MFRGGQSMNSVKKTRRKAVSLILIICMLVAVVAGCSGQPAKADDFSLWVKDAKSLAALKSYVSEVTNKNSKNFIPEEDRIAVFDMDGTLYGELAPIYVEWWMYAYRVNEDPSFKADAAEKEVADKIIASAKSGVIDDSIELNHAIQNARVFAGMTIEGYKQYVREFVKRNVVGFDNMTYKDAFYKPMIEVVKYLNANGFTVYICSGTDRFMCRELVSGVLPIADNHFIGMDVMLKARGQGNTDGLEYVYAKDDQVVRTDELLIKSVKMNKVSLLSRELGKAPVLCFGNSSGDESMAAYTTQNEKYLSKAFLLVADDDVRDYGSVEKGAQKAEKWRSKGWEVISMKNDWTTIYGGNVVKTSK